MFFAANLCESRVYLALTLVQTFRQRMRLSVKRNRLMNMIIFTERVPYIIIILCRPFLSCYALLLVFVVFHPYRTMFCLSFVLVTEISFYYHFDISVCGPEALFSLC